MRAVERSGEHRPTDGEGEKEDDAGGNRGYFALWLRDRGPAVVGLAIPFLFVLYLALEGGGYDSIVRGEVGIVAWWAVLVGSVALLLPASRPEPRSLLALVLLAGFGIWTAIGITWTDSVERTVIEVARIVTLLGVFGLAVSIQREGSLERTVVGVGAAIGVVAVLAVGSRIAPGIFPGEQTEGLLSEASYRLLYPVGYWNALAALVAIGLPLLVRTTAFSPRVASRALSGAVIPVAVLATYYTFSRGGTIAALIGLTALFALAPRRVEMLLRSALPILGSVLLVTLATGRKELADGIRSMAYQSQADEMAWITLLVVAIVGLGQLLLSRLEARGLTLSFRPARKTSLATLGVLGLVLIVGAVAIGLPGRISSGVDEFSSAGGPGQDSGRLLSAAGSNRSAYWEAAIDAAEAEPITGIGPGAYEFWWAANGEAQGFVRQAHSLPLQLLAETGPLGLLLVAGLFGVLIWTGGSRSLRSGDDGLRGMLAAATAGVLAFTVSSLVDWSWEVTVLPAAALFLGAAVLGPDAHRGNLLDAVPRQIGHRAPFVATGIVASLVGIAFLFLMASSASEIERSRDLFESGDSPAALGAARSAGDLNPWAATPLVQEALILNSEAKSGEAVRAAREATSKEPRDWRTWFVLTGVAAVAGRPGEATGAFERARALNPRGELFRQAGPGP